MIRSLLTKSNAPVLYLVQVVHRLVSWPMFFCGASKQQSADGCTERYSLKWHTRDLSPSRFFWSQEWIIGQFMCITRPRWLTPIWNLLLWHRHNFLQEAAKQWGTKTCFRSICWLAAMDQFLLSHSIHSSFLIKQTRYGHLCNSTKSHKKGSSSQITIDTATDNWRLSRWLAIGHGSRSVRNWIR